MFQSLKIQFIFSLASLFLVLFVQLYLSHQSESVLLKNQKVINLSIIKIEQVHELERMVLDLQRNVLVYKETGSDSSANNVEELIGSVEAVLAKVELGLASLEDKQVIGEVKLMRGHLSDYGDNFLNVIEGRRRRGELFDNVVIQGLSELASAFESQSGSMYKELDAEVDMAMKYNVSKAKNAAYQYLLSPDLDHEEIFYHHIDLIESFNNDTADFDKILQGKVKLLKKTFLQLAQTTRGYVFLVNVVMAGSANEFLFLTKKLKQYVIERQRNNNSIAIKLAKDVQLRSYVFSAICILLTVFIGFFLIVRIIIPIQRITDVFGILSKGGEVKQIPGNTRRDEVGLLAKAADTFHKNNVITNRLLVGSQKINSQLEKVNSDLEKEKVKAELAVKSKSMFLANMSHEIRTPMNGIIGLVDLALKTKLTDQQKNYLNKISYSGDIMMGVINDILDFSKIEAGKLEIENVSFSLDKILDNIISVLHLRVSEKNLNFRVCLQSNTPLNFIGDPLRINQILLNLCNNAIKFTDVGQIELRVDYKSLEGENVGLLCFEVVDSGIGMTVDQMGTIFDSFTQADGSTSRKFGGTGLGLAIVKQLSELMGGRVELESEFGEGSVFRVLVRVRLIDENKIFDVCNQKNKQYNCLYVPLEVGPLIDDCYLAATGLASSVYTLTELLTVDVDQRVVLIDVPSVEYAQKIEETVSLLVSSGARVGFVANAQPSNIKDYFLTKAFIHFKNSSGLSTISHPFSPLHLKKFIDGLIQLDFDTEQTLESLESGEVPLVGHVLLVEDNAINQLVAGDMLEDMGLTYDVVDDGAKAVDKVLSADNAYDLVLMDIQMPIMDGYEATRTLRLKGYDDLIICGLSANAMAEDIRKAEIAGMNDYITKPIDPNGLNQALKKYLAL